MAASRTLLHFIAFSVHYPFYFSSFNPSSIHLIISCLTSDIKCVHLKGWEGGDESQCHFLQLPYTILVICWQVWDCATPNQICCSNIKRAMWFKWVIPNMSNNNMLSPVCGDPYRHARCLFVADKWDAPGFRAISTCGCMTCNGLLRKCEEREVSI